MLQILISLIHMILTLILEERTIIINNFKRIIQDKCKGNKRSLKRNRIDFFLLFDYAFLLSYPNKFYNK